MLLEDATLFETRISLLSEGGVIAKPEPVQRETEGLGRETLSRELEETQRRCSEVDGLLEVEREQNATLQERLRPVPSTTEVSNLRDELKAEKERAMAYQL